MFRQKQQQSFNISFTIHPQFIICKLHLQNGDFMKMACLGLNMMPIQHATLQLVTFQLASVATLTTRHSDNSPL
jgi:hypothetical protein